MHRYALIFMTAFAIACNGGAVGNNSSGGGSGGNETKSGTDPHSNHKSIDHGANGSVTKASHIMESSPGAESAPLELQFLDSMIAHHKGAVEMAMLAEVRAGREEIKELAANIIHNQEREIAKMSEWRDQWFAEKPEAINMKFPGMAHGMNGMDMKSLELKKGGDFDLEIIRQMIPHHEGAIEMAKSVREADARTELKELAADIIAAQDAEIRQMREWLAKWSTR